MSELKLRPPNGKGKCKYKTHGNGPAEAGGYRWCGRIWWCAGFGLGIVEWVRFFAALRMTGWVDPRRGDIAERLEQMRLGATKRCDRVRERRRGARDSRDLEERAGARILLSEL